MMYKGLPDFSLFALLLALQAPELQAETSLDTFPRTYFFEGDEVVFEFDVRMYEEATPHGKSKRVDFGEFDIHEVALSGEFNNWSRDGWQMKKISPYKYQLRKPISAFDDNFKWEFKFIINGSYWAEPIEEIPNKVKIVDHFFWEDVYNLEMYNIDYDPNGNVYFFLPGHEDARQVILSGEFNGWDEHKPQMRPVKGGWEIRVSLEPGRYEYKYIVDGNWITDPGNLEKVENVHGTYNSVLKVTQKVTFFLEGFSDAQQVVLAGSFNDWSDSKMPMKRTPQGWQLSLDLPGGKHHYKFIIDGEWMIDPKNPIKEWDWDGNLNSVKIVQ
jgi:hypothetical protein